MKNWIVYTKANVYNHVYLQNCTWKHFEHDRKLKKNQDLSLNFLFKIQIQNSSFTFLFKTTLERSFKMVVTFFKDVVSCSGLFWKLIWRFFFYVFIGIKLSKKLFFTTKFLK